MTSMYRDQSPIEPQSLPIFEKIATSILTSGWFLFINNGLGVICRVLKVTKMI